jgi:hypothetical protein
MPRETLATGAEPAGAGGRSETEAMAGERRR